MSANGKQLSILAGASALALLLMSAQAMAFELLGHKSDDGHKLDVSLPDGGGTLAMAGDLSSLGETLTDDEMSEMRGGFNGFAFSMVLAAYNDLNSLNGLTAVTFDSTGLGIVGTPSITDLGGGQTQIDLTTAAGSFGGFNGFLQSAYVVGNFNTVNQYMDMQINIYNFGNGNGVRLQNIPLLTGL